MQPSLVWQKYEAYIFKQLKAYYPQCVVKLNHKVRGKFSKSYRQIDISIQTKVEGFELFGIVDCKHYNTKIDVKDIESILGFTEDVGADFGYIITNRGFTKSALRHVADHNLLLRVIVFPELNEALFTLDELIDRKIYLLDCIPSVFFIRQQQRSAFVNLHITSYDAKTLAYKEGFAETPYFAHKKLLEETARVFRDFPCLRGLK